SVKNYNDDGSYTEATYDDGTTKYDHGMYLQYEAGNKTKYYIKPGYYRFVHFHRQAQTITYSDVYQITDKNGVYTEPGSADVSFTANGFDTPVNSLLSDDTFDMAITSLKGADGNDISLNSADVTNIEFLTNYWYIPINGSSLDSVVSYEYSYSYPMYNGSEVADGRTLVKTNDAITLKNCTAKWIVKGNNIASLLSDGEIYKYRVKVTANVGGEEKVFMTDAPIKITAAYSVTTIITDSLNKGSIGLAYNAQLSGATPDKSELKWTVDSGELPPGLSLTQSGQITGTPTTAGTYKFKVKMTATGDGTSDTKEYTVVITKRQLSGYWWMNLTSASYYRGDTTNYTVTAKPRISGGTPFEGTPVSGTTLNVSLDYGVLQNDSTVTVTKPASGVTASLDSYNITLTFDGSAEITADGIEFTINNAKNPNSSYIYSSVSSTSNDKNSQLETDTTDMSIINGYTHTPLTSADGINLTIEGYESYKDMDMRLVITHNNEDTISYISGSVTGIDNLGIQKGDEYTVRLEAKDALWNGHTYYQSGTLTGDGNGNPLTITPNPAASDTLKGYTLTSTLAGVANRDIPTALYKDGKRLYSVNGYYWLTNAEGITANPDRSFSSSYPDYDSEGAVTVNGTQITVDYPKLAQTAQLTGTVKNTASEPVANAAVVANVNINGTTVTYNTVTAKDGRYTLNNMYNGKNVTITAWADGYEEGSKTVTLNNTATADITLSPTSSITVT
ncbi:MAG: carboxypeptidase regulatory-like domain-containing protein, partial [Clostridia bacterium]|nr:carboxypeptidase regulatory-like domain-containing protein [Clostridia bacterium]